jgi:hypothetical protein
VIVAGEVTSGGGDGVVERGASLTGGGSGLAVAAAGARLRRRRRRRTSAGARASEGGVHRRQEIEIS